jgi:type II secretory pathway component PulF
MGQWAELLQSGMSVLDALVLSGELQSNNRQGKLLHEKLQRTAVFIQAGQNLQTAFRASCGTLPLPLDVALLCAQANGDLSTALQEQLQRWKTTSAANQTLARSLIYPGVVLTMAICCWVFLHHVSSPHWGNAQPTVGAAELLLVSGGITLFLSLCFRLSRKQETGLHTRFILPNKAWLASNFYHVIGCELNAGIDLMHCLRYRTMPLGRLPACINPNHSMLHNLNLLAAHIHKNLKQGMNLAQAMQKAQAPQFLIRQSQLAEQTGNLSNCFLLASKVYEMQARCAQQRLQNILPPLALSISALTLAMAYQFTLAPLYSNLTGLS